ncbi:2-phosphosulfolactate phosphatase [Teichococcus vastitatis]|uniref:Probable 2-phosphosulfolactate phosphatase n=1 Tax=Teichococcus vastitatis TaxID=2307076 RepID=A0ABS9W9W9_9PROT|nr:2-phosphosulfolactate phosphatase [Pseudoroseomonas vastitatis]MCI0756094.1 2-phosphosulfolactate phosphatase [Pseudoroseomonas vastitatis]
MESVLTEWGMAGVETLREQAAVLVIVDVLSFSTAVDIAVSQGATVFPFSYGDRRAAEVAAERVGAVLARPRKAAGGQISLSPASLRAVMAGTRLMLPSPNGSRLSLACGDTPVLTGCLRNAAAVAQAARQIARGGAIGVVPAGERWPDESLRPAIEDLLGAGAIVHHLGLPCSPEAQVARDAFRSAADDLMRLIRASVSGRELIDRGFSNDVDVALEIEASGCAPFLSEGAYPAA